MTESEMPSYFSAVSSPVYSRADNSTIDCTVTISPDAPTPWAGTTHQYTAASHDPMDYGVALYNYLIAGGAGPIGAYVAPTLTPQQQVQAAIVAGINVTSTATPSLSGTYPIDPGTQQDVNNEIVYIGVNGAFSSGSSLPWFDASGNVHNFTQISDFKNFATAFALFCSAIRIYAKSNGTQGSIPSNNITIP